MLLSVQQAARRLGVSPVTVRRWTATGLLPCTRTAGGHRRIDARDIDDLARAIGSRDHEAAQLAREREVDVLIDTAVALAVKLDLTELLLEIAMRMTSLLDCHFCAISEYDPVTDATVTLAEFDRAGHRIPDASPYRLRDYPLTRSVLAEQTTAVVNVDDPDADPAEVRREGDRSLLMVPLVVQGRSIGLVEVVDQRRARSFSRQELRLAGAIAGQAAVALQNAKLFAERQRSQEDITALRAALARLARGLPRLGADARGPDALTAVAAAVCDALGAVSCVATAGGESAGAFSDGAVAGPPEDSGHGETASVVVARDPSGDSDLTVAVTLPRPPGEGQAELLDLIAALAALLVGDRRGDSAAARRGAPPARARRGLGGAEAGDAAARSGSGPGRSGPSVPKPPD